MTRAQLESASGNTTQQFQELAVLYELSKELSSSLDSDEIQRAVLRCAMGAVNGEVAALLLSPDSSSQPGWKLQVYVSGIEARAAAKELEASLLSGMRAMSGELEQANEIQLVIDETQMVEQSMPDQVSLDLESVISLPLIVGAEAIGMLGVASVVPERFNSTHLELLATVANQAAVAINNSRLYKQTLLEKQQLETILNNMSDGLLVLDENWRVVTMNPTLERMLGLEAKEVLGRCPSEASSDPRLASLATLCGGRGPDSPFDRSGVEANVVEWDVTLNTSGRRAVRASAAVDTDAAGRYLGEVMVVHDVTRERELEQMKSDFLANTSHELRTPLHSIKGFIKLLLEGKVPDPDSQREFLTIIKEQSDLLGILVDDLLDVSRIDAGHLELNRDQLSMGSVIDKTVRKLANLANDKGIEFEISVSPSLSIMQGDEGRLTQALTNLLGNAIKFSYEKGRIIVRAKTVDSEVLVQVVDHGLGIPPESIPRLFERFYQVDGSTTRQNPGTGLGLYITRQIIESHGGRIWVESKVGEGSTFSFNLPLDACADMPINEQSGPDAKDKRC